MAAEFLSVGVNALNEEISVARMLESVFKNTLWKKTPQNQRELVFYADGCTDNTVGVVRKMQKAHPEMRVIEGKQRMGFAYSRNRLAKEMNPKAKVFFFFDADIVLQRKTMEVLKRALDRNQNIDAAAAELIPAAKFISKSKRRLFANLSVTRYERRVKKDLRIISGAGYAVRSKVIKKIRLPEELQGHVDLFLSRRIGSERITRVKEAGVIFRDPVKLGDFRKKALRLEFAKLQLRKHLGEKPIPGLKLKKQARIFSSLPLSQKIAAIGVKGANLVGKVQARIAWRKYKKSKKVDAWKKTTSDRQPKRRKR